MAWFTESDAQANIREKCDSGSMPADKYRRLVKSMGGSSVLDKYKNLQEGFAPGISPPPAVHGVPHGTWT